jgi:hypothetical protein
VDPEALMDDGDDDDGILDMDAEGDAVVSDIDLQVPAGVAFPATHSSADPQGSDNAAEPTENDANEGVTGPYIQLFLLKYVCPRVACFGTLAPRLGERCSECNLCGKTRSDDDFMAAVQAMADVGA